jgi:hypothetical protein
MVLRSSRLISFVIVFLLLSISIVYACPGMNLMVMTSMSSGMDDVAVKRGPCRDHKQDICQSVRDRMRSDRPSSHVADIMLHALTVLHFAQLNVPLFMNLPLTEGPPGVLPHPVLKFSFPVSNPVLRI